MARRAAEEAFSICSFGRGLLVPEMRNGEASGKSHSEDAFAGVVVGLIDDSVNVYLKVISSDGEHFSEVHMPPKYAMALGQALIVAATRYN